MRAVPDQFSIAVTSDPQYPWYDNVLPPELKTEDQIKANSQRQIREQYESINTLARERAAGEFPLEGVILNGDLTAFGHDWQLSELKSLVSALSPQTYPALGNHDYANNVNDCANNDCATRMALYMIEWLRGSSGHLETYDLKERSYYQFPELRTDYTGSMAYSLNLGSVHLAVLQNFPSYADEWNSWSASEAQRLFFYIKPSFFWLANDLARARNRGDAILVFLHDYNDNFVDPPFTQFRELMARYGVTAVFAGHIHEQCGLIDRIPASDAEGIPVFRSGAASFQDYLLAEVDLPGDSLKVTKYEAGVEEKYEAGESWSFPVNRTKPVPPMPVPPEMGYVTFYADGGFEARFELRYKDYAGNQVTHQTGTMLLGNKRTYDLPPYATEIQLKGEENTGLVWEGWRTVFNLSFEQAPNRCYRLYGTTLNPKWDNQC